MGSQRLIIHAPNVHVGGGQALLRELLSALPADACGAALLDQRFSPDLPIPPGIAVRRFAPTLCDRLSAEWQLMRMAGADARILCFGNLPPLFRCRGRVSVFLHNRHLIGGTDISDFRTRTRLRLHAERLWIRLYGSHTDEWIVQTESMQSLAGSLLRRGAPIRILPFVPSEIFVGRSGGAAPRLAGFAAPAVDFCYVASGDPHKNHRKLIQAWVLLALEGIFPTLRITVDERQNGDLCDWIDRQKRQYGVRVENVGRVPPEEVAAIYRSSRCLIHPSWCESFGLPLLEAESLGIPIVAAELDYVRDLVRPAETFDPQSPRSIARAVQRFLGARPADVALLDGRSFLERLAAA